MHFGITEKPTTECVSLYNNPGLTSKVSEKIASEKNWKLPLSTTPLLFDATAPGNLSEYSHKHYTAGNYSHCPSFLLLIVSVYLHSNFCGGLRKTHLFCNRVLIGSSRSSKVVDFGMLKLKQRYIICWLTFSAVWWICHRFQLRGPPLCLGAPAGQVYLKIAWQHLPTSSRHPSNAEATWCKNFFLHWLRNEFRTHANANASLTPNGHATRPHVHTQYPNAVNTNVTNDNC